MGYFVAVTVNVPFIAACRSQVYVYVPGFRPT